jgi:23S rRNA (guanosine2251-2'-O)-methyltransferase
MVLEHHLPLTTYPQPYAAVVGAAEPVSPKDRFVTVYGRKPVLEALADEALAVDKVLLADNARGPAAREILDAAARRGVPVRRASPHRVKVLAGNGRHDQGVLADVVAPRMRPLASFLSDLDAAGAAGAAGVSGAVGAAVASVLVLDQITNPANVGMILRTATAAGLDGVVLPRRGVPGVDPLVVKASAGVAFHAPVLRCATAAEACAALSAAGFTLYGLGADAPESVFTAPLADRAAFALGNETTGVSDPVRAAVHGWLSIPMAGGVESLNVASAAAVLSFELVRRRGIP